VSNFYFSLFNSHRLSFAMTYKLAVLYLLVLSRKSVVNAFLIVLMLGHITHMVYILYI
jgi:hypothetical protein